MKILTLHQPWATLWALGIKEKETRDWRMKYRGDLAIHAGTRPMRRQELQLLEVIAMDFDVCLNPERLPLGAIVGWANVTGCWPTEHYYGEAISAEEEYELEFLLGDYSEGRFAIVVENPKALLKPIPYQGQPGLKDLPKNITNQVRTAQPVPASRIPNPIFRR